MHDHAYYYSHDDTKNIFSFGISFTFVYVQLNAYYMCIEILKLNWSHKYTVYF